MNLVGLILASSVSVAVVTSIFGEILKYFLRKREKANDRDQQRFEEEHAQLIHDVQSLAVDVQSLTVAEKVNMYDRIKYLGTRYITAGEIDFDDRRVLNQMHEAYHGLGGNGDLDNLMKQVNKLPLKQ